MLGFPFSSPNYYSPMDLDFDAYEVAPNYSAPRNYHSYQPFVSTHHQNHHPTQVRYQRQMPVAEVHPRHHPHYGSSPFGGQLAFRSSHFPSYYDEVDAQVDEYDQELAQQYYQQQQQLQQQRAKQVEQEKQRQQQQRIRQLLLLEQQQQQREEQELAQRKAIVQQKLQQIEQAQKQLALQQQEQTEQQRKLQQQQKQRVKQLEQKQVEHKRQEQHASSSRPFTQDEQDRAAEFLMALLQPFTTSGRSVSRSSPLPTATANKTSIPAKPAAARPTPIATTLDTSTGTSSSNVTATGTTSGSNSIPVTVIRKKNTSDSDHLSVPTTTSSTSSSAVPVPVSPSYVTSSGVMVEDEPLSPEQLNLDAEDVWKAEDRVHTPSPSVSPKEDEEVVSKENTSEHATETGTTSVDSGAPESDSGSSAATATTA